MLCTIPHVGHAPTRWSIDRKSVPRDPADIDGLSVATLRAKVGAWRDEFYRIRHWPIDWNTSHGATPRLNAVREGRGRGYTRDVRLCATAASTRARRSGPGHPRGICSLTGNLASTTKSDLACGACHGHNATTQGQQEPVEWASSRHTPRSHHLFLPRAIHIYSRFLPDAFTCISELHTPSYL